MTENNTNIKKSHINRPLADISKGVDLYNIIDWNRIIEKINQDKFACFELAEDRAFKINRVSGRAHAVWGFDTEKHALRLFHGNKIQRNESCKDPYEDRREGVKDYIHLGAALIHYCDDKPSLDQVINLLKKNRKNNNLNLIDILDELGEKYHLHWCSFDKLVMAGLFNINNNKDLLPKDGKKKVKSDNSDKISNDNSTKKRAEIHGLTTQTNKEIENELFQFYDYFWLKNNVWRSAPLDLFRIRPSNLNDLINVMSDPFAFDPRHKDHPKAFLWPWQRCMISTGVTGKEQVTYQSIPTVSLVLDLRFSTIAMGLSTAPSDFAVFIEKIVYDSKQHVLKNGGFFDKETGDGIIGHFCEINNPLISLSSEPKCHLYRAIKSAREIIRDLKDICREYQEVMLHGLHGLQPAIGMHIGDAVWMVNEGQIRAIGDSVVQASRLCSSADGGEILISNAVYYNLVSNHEHTLEKNFNERPFEIKEYQELTKLYAYSWKP